MNYSNDFDPLELNSNYLNPFDPYERPTHGVKFYSFKVPLPIASHRKSQLFKAVEAFKSNCVLNLCNDESANTPYHYNLKGKLIDILPLHLACVLFTKEMAMAQSQARSEGWTEKEISDVFTVELRLMFQIIEDIAVCTLPENLDGILSAKPYNGIDPAARRVLFQYLNVFGKKDVALNARQREDDLSKLYGYKKITGDDYFKPEQLSQLKASANDVLQDSCIPAP